MPFVNTQETGRPVTIKDEGLTLTPNVGSIDFTGSGVSGSVVGSDVTESISGSAGTSVFNEIVSGSNVTFTLAHTPIAGTVAVYALGQRLVLTTDYTISSAVITTTSSWLAGQIVSDYQY